MVLNSRTSVRWRWRISERFFQGGAMAQALETARAVALITGSDRRTLVRTLQIRSFIPAEMQHSDGAGILRSHCAAASRKRAMVALILRDQWRFSGQM